MGAPSRPAFPATWHLMALVAYSGGICAVLVPLARLNAADFGILAALVVLGAPRLVSLAIRLVETPGPRRDEHGLLALALERFSAIVVVFAAIVAIWAFDWADLPFFLRIEGRHWLVSWIALPLWFLALARLLLARGRSGARVRSLVLATVALCGAVAFRELAPRLLDRDLLNLARGLATAGLLVLLWHLLPGRCPACSRWGLVGRPARSPGDRLAGRCLACGASPRA